jgi:hypothetical protein
MPSRQASGYGQALIRQRKLELGWLYTDERWAVAFGKLAQPELDWEQAGKVNPYLAISECSLRRFQKGDRIVAQNFNILCQALGLEPNLVAADVDPIRPLVDSSGELAVMDLTDMPKNDFFCGRQQELAEIDQWLTKETVTFLNIWGAPGVGKSALMAHWIENQTTFQNVIWRSVDCEHLEISCKDFVEDLLEKFLSKTERSRNCFNDFSKLLDQRKILIVIAGNFNNGYLEWFRRLESQRYLSCVVIISEPDLRIVFSNKNATKSRGITGFSSADVKLFWRYYTHELVNASASDNDIEILTDRYEGNPALLGSIIKLIKINHAGNLRRAMDDTIVVPGGLKGYLDKLFDSLAPEEQRILIVMAGSEDKMSLGDIKFLTRQSNLVGKLDNLRIVSILQMKNNVFGFENDESSYSISTLWRRYLQRRFLEKSSIKD